MFFLTQFSASIGILFYEIIDQTWKTNTNLSERWSFHLNWQIINTKQTHIEASNCLKNYFPVPVWKIINQLLPSFLKLHNIKHGQLRFCPAVYLGPGLWWHFTCVFVSPMHNFIWKSGNWLHFLLWKTQNMYLIRQNVFKVAITPNIKYTLVTVSPVTHVDSS